MLPRQVIVRAHWGEPLKRIPVGASEGVVYIASGDPPADSSATVAASYGVAQDDVFEYDETAYSAIRTAFKLELLLDGDVWTKLKPFRLGGSFGTRAT
jgi:hypothetical protein